MLRHTSFVALQALWAELTELRGMAASAEADLRSAQDVGGSGSPPAPGELEELRDMARAEAEELLAQVRGHTMRLTPVPISVSRQATHVCMVRDRVCAAVKGMLL